MYHSSDKKEKHLSLNTAFIDGQNLHLGTKESGWTIDFAKFRRYLLDKYNVSEAYYFLGYVSEAEHGLYDNLQRSGFILSFREHTPALKGKKKGNVDSDIVFAVMKNIVEKETGKILLVSGDGDYKKLVEYLVKKNKFIKILFPNRKFASSLYNSLGSEYFDWLDKTDVRLKIEYR
jgi:uncharacterized LabA/DUF88 family protein